MIKMARAVPQNKRKSELIEKYILVKQKWQEKISTKDKERGKTKYTINIYGYTHTHTHT